MNRKILYLIGIVIAICALIIIPPCPAPLINGTFYWRNATPGNDIYETAVNPGDTIVLGRTYDLTNVYGVSGQFAWWKNQADEGMTCNPDLVNDVDYIDSNGTIFKSKVTLDPAHWHTGEWWQWDGCYAMKYQKDHPDPVLTTYQNDDNLMFTIINDPHPPTPIPTTIITPTPPTPTPIIITGMVTPIPTPAPVQADPGWQWWYYVIAIIILFIAWRILW
jgi:hypothetical protein